MRETPSGTGGRGAPGNPGIPGGAGPGAPDFSGGTGDPTVDAALERLATLGTRPVAEHVEEYEIVHRALQDALTAIDQG